MKYDREIDLIVFFSKLQHCKNNQTVIQTTKYTIILQYWSFYKGADREWTCRGLYRSYRQVRGISFQGCYIRRTDFS